VLDVPEFGRYFSLLSTRMLTRIAAGNYGRYGVGDKMADYYPLISKAVAGLADDASGERQALYDRMREALSAALRTTEPPFTEFQVMRERLALEDVVRRVEEEVAGRGRDAAIPAFDDLADDTNEVGIGVEVPLMIVSGSATGRWSRVWRCAWRQQALLGREADAPRHSAVGL
jgi:hypothetical protein